MARTGLPIAVLFAFILAQPATAFDDPFGGWVGKKIMFRNGSAPYRYTDDQGRQMEYGPVPEAVVPVSKEDGDRLWIRSHSREGWVEKKEAILLEEASAFFSEKVRANPDSPWAYNMRAIAWAARGELENAIDDYTDAIRLDPNSAIAFNNRGNAWGEKKVYTKAIADYTDAIRLNPDYAVAYNNRGSAWDKKKDYDKAIADYTEALRIDPKYALVYKNRGIVWGRKQEYDKAIDDYTEAIRIYPNYAVAFDERGNVWDKKKEYEKAIADFTEAVRIDPKYALAFNNLAWRLATIPKDSVRDGKKAVEFATKACELTNWKEANFVDTLAAAYAESGQFEKAIDWEKKAREDGTYLDQHDKESLERLKLYEQKKPYRE